MCLICSRIEMIKAKENPYFVKELETGYVVIGDHQHFHGYTLFLFKHHVTDLDQLDKATRDTFLSEMAEVSIRVKQAFGAEKMNCELLGNGDAHLHWHLFPRVACDLDSYGHEGRGPVWWYPLELMISEDTRPSLEALAQMKAQLMRYL